MTVHISTADHMLDHMMSELEGQRALHATHQGLRDGRWSEEYIDAIGQHGVRSRSGWPMAQVAAFAVVHGMIVAGDVAMVPVSTDGPPCRDSDRAANVAALSNLPHPFTASVDMEQNCGDGDGMIAWTEPIEVTVSTRLTDLMPNGVRYPHSLHLVIPAGKATLEIGSSLPSRTWMHLALEGGAVARWPYGHSRFRLFVNLGYAAGIERLGESLEPAATSSRNSALAQEHQESVRSACAALGHPRTLTHADVAKHTRALPAQRALW